MSGGTSICAGSCFDSNYKQDNSKCKPCKNEISGCFSCTTEPVTCTACLDGYRMYIAEGIPLCEKCDAPYCSKCDNSKDVCTQCDSDHVLKDSGAYCGRDCPGSQAYDKNSDSCISTCKDKNCKTCNELTLKSCSACTSNDYTLYT